VASPYCHGDQVVKRGKTDTGKQRYRGHNPECAHQSFRLVAAYQGRSPQIKQQVIERRLNGRGIRDTARVFQISMATVMRELKKRTGPHGGQYAPREHLTTR
jgi:transposase-like protein